MTLKADLDAYCYDTFVGTWEKRNGTVVPSDTSLKLSNDGINLSATVLYADLADSTVMVDKEIEGFAAEVYKSFLYCAAKIIRAHSGTVTAYDGDRIMAVFIGDSKNTSAVKAALQINWAVKNIVQAQLKAVYKDKFFTVNHVVGIDTSGLLVAKTGIRGSNDLVWVGRAANYAAKLSALSHERPTYITAEVYNQLNDEAKFSTGTNIWKPYKWNTFDDRIIYGSTYWWSVA
jgi:class 3 adenylate cyclase